MSLKHGLTSLDAHVQQDTMHSLPTLYSLACHSILLVSFPSIDRWTQSVQDEDCTIYEQME